ncbi:MAG: hypothetical protein KKB20_12805 [Proteobacteria bacterium]|nr:hypothetical protein [Pseudomonadota bacterium]
MLWNKVLLIFDSSENSLRAVEYVAKMYGKTEGLQVTIFGIYEKVPRHDFKGTSPVVDKLHSKLATMEIEIARGQARIKEAQTLLAKAGIDSKAISIKYMERKTSAAKDAAAEARDGGYGTIIVGRGDSKGYILAGGNIAKDLVSQLKDRAVCVV